MHNLRPAWQPQVGERVGIRVSGFLGVVKRIEGRGNGTRFVLKVVASPDDDVGALNELAQAASVARTVYTLAELTLIPSAAPLSRSTASVSTQPDPDCDQRGAQRHHGPADRGPLFPAHRGHTVGTAYSATTALTFMVTNTPSLTTRCGGSPRPGRGRRHRCQSHRTSITITRSARTAPMRVRTSASVKASMPLA